MQATNEMKEQPHSHQQNVYASLGLCVNLKFSFLNFVQQRGTVTRFENPSRHKHKRYHQLGHPRGQ